MANGQIRGVNGGAGALQPNITSLPTAVYTQAPNSAAYSALNVPSLAAGTSYTDPTTGVVVWKLTSSTSPAVNTTGWRHSYADGGAFQSRAFGSNLDTHWVGVYGEGAGFAKLVKFQRGVGVIASQNWAGGASPGSGDTYYCFSNNAATPQRVYVLVQGGTTLVQYDIDTATVTTLKTIGASAFWLNIDAADRWYVWQIGTTAYAWDRQTDTTISQTITALNEPRLMKEGGIVELVIDGYNYYRWDLNANTVSSLIATGRYHAHQALLKNYSLSANQSNPYKNWRTSTTGTDTALSGNGSSDPAHHSGNWVQSANDTTQWWLASSYLGQTATYNPYISRGLLYNGIMYNRLDGSDPRFLAHSYSTSLKGDGTSYEYWAHPLAQPSPDGKIVVFNSNMMTNGGRHDVFCIEVPLA